LKKSLKIALLGNPNTGKSTIFNELTGLNQKIGNFPGVTIDKKTGCFSTPDNKIVEVIDLPGIYSLYAKSKDENIAFEVLCDKSLMLRPDIVVLVTDSSNLKRNMLLCTQVADLGLPMIMVLNMIDIAHNTGIQINIDKLAHKLGIRVIALTAKDGKGIDKLKQEIAQSTLIPTQKTIFQIPPKVTDLANELMYEFKLNTPYEALQLANQHHLLPSIRACEHLQIEEILKKHNLNPVRLQVEESVARYAFIKDLLNECVVQNDKQIPDITNKLDKILMHRHFAMPIFIFILFLVFQSIFMLAEYPMMWIENLFMWFQQTVSNTLPE
jgi:ferrous iron transport protein B